MMHLLDWSWYLARLALWPLRYGLYLTHGFLIFVSKPGARYIIAAAMAALIGWQWDSFAATFGADVRALLRDSRDILGPLSVTLDPWRTHLAAAMMIVGTLLISGGWSIMLRPLIGAVPAPSRPLLPQPPFREPRLHIRTVAARVAVTRIPSAGIGGNLGRLVRRMPPEIRALLERDPMPAGRYPGPGEITESKPLWPPLGLQTAPAEAPPRRAAPAATAAPPPPPPPAEDAVARPGRSSRAAAATTPKRTSSRAAQGKGEPPVPPPPKRGRRIAAE